MNPDPASPKSPRPRRRTAWIATGLFALAAAVAASAIAVFPGFRRELDRPQSGAARGSGGVQPQSPEPRASRIVLADVTREAGISFRHEAGARGKLYNPETFGSGSAWLDYDGDGRIDLLFVNSNLLEGEPDPSATSILYRNRGDGTFEDVTARAGLAVPLYGMGCVSGDVDNDGDQDLLLYGLHRSRFFSNRGGKFEDTTEASGLSNLPGWICAATFLDYDRDGDLDLFIGNYVQWSPKSEEGVDCNFGTPRKKYCPVAMFDPSSPQLFRNRGDGTFEETTEAAGLRKLKGKTLGVAVEDYDRDGYPDIFVANDSVPNFLLHNQRDGTFEDRGTSSGFATDADGAALAGMGIDTAWAPDGGPLYTAIGNFSGEPTTLHVQQDVEYFVERSISTGVGRETLDRVTFGLLLVDVDLDGWLDLFTINGHVFDVEDITGVPYAQKPLLFLGRDWRKFSPVEPSGPEDFLARPIIGRSLAFADYDRDGDLDFAVTVNQGAAILLRNDSPGPRRWVRIDLRGTKSNRDAIGAEATLHLLGPAGAKSFRRTRKAVSSYLSQSERVLTFGVPDGFEPASVEVLWPSGLREHFSPVPLARESLFVEGTGAREPSEALVAVRARPRAPEAKELSPGSGSAGANPVVLRRKGAELYRMGRFAEALPAFEAAARAEPEDFVTQRFILMSLHRLGRRREVDERVSEIVRLFPDAKLIVSHFALVLRETGYAELAEKMFREASRLDPKRVDVWISLGNFSFDRRELDEAFRCYLQAVKLKPDSVEALANIGKVHTLWKNYDQALPYLERALELRPDYATALSTLGGVHIELRNYERAEEILNYAAGLRSSKETQVTIHGNLGILYYKTGRRERAKESFEKVLELDPEDRQAQAVLERLRRP